MTQSQKQSLTISTVAVSQLLIGEWGKLLIYFNLIKNIEIY
jgi:hypothetical protein